MKDLKEFLWKSLGVILLPIIFIIWSIDRMLHISLFWVQHKNFETWADYKHIARSLIRIILLTIGYFVARAIYYHFN